MPSGGGDTSIIEAIKRELRNTGFDIFHRFQPKWYNASVERDGLQDQLVSLPETGPAFLIGNTKFVWPFFKAWYAGQSSPCQKDPFDTYCRECIEKSLRKHYHQSEFKVFWECKKDPDVLVSMQRVASVSAFAYHDPVTQLTIHPVYGPWHSYRAVFVLSGGESLEKSAPPRLVPCLLSTEEEECAKEALTRALQVSDTSNLCRQLHGENDDPKRLAVCLAWIAMRDCVERGRSEYRFDEDQLMYHYTKDISYLNGATANEE